MSIPANALCPAIGQVLEDMYFLAPTYEGPGTPVGPVLGATLHFGGAFDGEFRVVVNRELAARLTAEFLAADPAAVTENDTTAAVRELTNVACGAALSSWMPSASFRFCIPRMLNPEEASETFDHCFSAEGGPPDIAFNLSID